jgi:hypothetical protein
MGKRSDHNHVLANMFMCQNSAREATKLGGAVHLFSQTRFLAEHPCPLYQCGGSGRPSMEGLPTLVTHTMNCAIMVGSGAEAFADLLENERMPLLKCPGMPR